MSNDKHISLYFFVVCLIFLCALVPEKPKTQSSNEFNSYKQALPGTDITIEMVPITGGRFQQGSPEHETNRRSGEGPQFEIAVEDFWMGKYEITWQQYELFMQRAIDKIDWQNAKGIEITLAVDGVSSATTPYVDMSFGMGKVDCPAINVTQYAASMFCQWLSATTGNFYRLPTESEWEYACRAGTTSTFNFGENVEDLDQYAWFNGNSEDKYHAVGQKEPNNWGLYDMHGNVSEWTLDQYDEHYYEELAANGKEGSWNLPSTLYPRTTRGGSWKDGPEDLRSAARKPSDPKWKRRDPQLPKSLWWLTNAPFVGFRIVRPRNTPTKEKIDQYWIKPIKDI